MQGRTLIASARIAALDLLITLLTERADQRIDVIAVVLERQGALMAVSAGEGVVPASELPTVRAKLQRVLGKKTVENEILKESVEYAAEKKWIARSPLLPGDSQ